MNVALEIHSSVKEKSIIEIVAINFGIHDLDLVSDDFIHHRRTAFDNETPGWIDEHGHHSQSLGSGKERNALATLLATAASRIAGDDKVFTWDGTGSRIRSRLVFEPRRADGITILIEDGQSQFRIGF